MKNKLISYLSLLLIALTCFSACSSDSKPTAVKSSNATNVTVYTTGKSSIVNNVSYSGSISAADSVSVSARVSARAISVPVKAGDYVSAGAVLASLDKTDLLLAQEQAQAAYNSALAAYNSVVNSSSKQSLAQANQALVSAQTAYNQAKSNYDREKILYENASNLKIAEQNYNNAKDAYERLKKLFELGGASQVELDAAYTQYLSAEENLKTVRATVSATFDAAKAALENAENALNNAKENIALTEAAVKSAMETAKASVDSARAALNMASNNLSNTSITAPISGYLSKCVISEGQTVAPGVEIFAISNTGMVDANINVTESVISSLEIGSPAVVSVSSAQSDSLSGSVTLINPVKDAMTGLYNVKISLDNSENKLKVGMLCDVELTLSQNDDVIKVPSEALINVGDKYYVYVADGNKAQKTEIITGISDESYTEVVSGLEAGTKVVVSGKDYLSEKNNDINITGEYKEK